MAGRMFKEEIDFWILDILIKHAALPVVRRRFDVIVPPNDLANVLNNNANILLNLFSRNVINVNDKYLLVRVPGVKLGTIRAPSMSATSSKDFDLTLMICLLRNLNLVSEPATGWDQIPPHSDKSLGANMTRIKIYRNKLSHSSTNRTNAYRFEKIWTSLKTALNEINEGGSGEVHQIETLHRNMQANMTNVLTTWQSELDVFYITRGTTAVLDKIRTNNAVMIIGNSGAGKSATMKYVSFLIEDEGYQITPVSAANDILSSRCSYLKQLFIIDDIFGKYRVDSRLFDPWRRLDDRLKVIFRDGNVKLLCTLRRQLQNDICQLLHETIFETSVIDLDSSDLTLSEIEKQGMLKNHLLHRNIDIQFDDIAIHEICSCNYAFPLMCQLFSSNSDFFTKKENFFTSPSVIRKEFDHLQKENKKVYCALVLIVIFDCEELKNIFDITCEINRKDDYRIILQACGVTEAISRISLYHKLLSVSGVFVRSDNPFKFIHDNIEETVAFHFGSRFPKEMLKCCKSAFLRERIRITRHETDDENILVISSSYDALSQRFLKEIMNGKFHDILLSEPLQNKVFVNRFVSQIKKSKTALHDLKFLHCTEMLLPSYLQVEKNFRDAKNINKEALTEVLQSNKRQFIYWVAATGRHLLFHKIFDRSKSKSIALRLHERYTLIDDLCHIAVLGGSMDIIKSLIKMGANVNSCDKYGVPLLCKIAGTKRCDIAELLIKEGASVNQQDEVLGWTACHAASWFNDIGMLKLLLSKGGDANISDYILRMPLFLAVMRNNEKAVSVLLENNACISTSAISFNFGMILLQEALQNKNCKITNMLLNSNKVVNYIGVSFPVPFPKNNVINEMLRLFLTRLRMGGSTNPLWDDFITVCDAIYNNDTPSILNTFNRIHPDELDDLVNFNENYLKFSLLHVAAVCDNYDAADVLMRYGADQYKRDIHGRTSLHLANSGIMLKCLLNRRNSQSASSCLLQILSKVCRIFEDILYNVNVKDKFGNTPMHSVVIRTPNVKKCLDAVETLIEYGADPCLRCSRGFLPIDHFRNVSQAFEKCDIDRGEDIFGYNKTKRFIKIEKWYLIFQIVGFIALYSLLCSFDAKQICCGLGSEISEPDFLLRKFHYSNRFCSMCYSQSITVIILHQVILSLSTVIQSLRLGGMIHTQVRSDVYAERLFVLFSDKVSIAIIAIRVFFYGMCSITGQTIFSLYCVCLCFFVVVIHFPFPMRQIYRKYQSLLLTVFKVILGWFLIWMILALFLSSSTESQCTYNLGHDNFYCVCLCAFLVVVYFPFPMRQIHRKYQYLLQTVFKVKLGCFLIWMNLALFLSSSTKIQCTYILGHENLYCVCLCFFLVVIYFPFPIRRIDFKCQSLVLTAFQVKIGWYIISNILAFYLNPSTEKQCAHKNDHHNWIYIRLFKFFLMRILIVFCIYQLFFKVRQLFYNLNQPVYWHRNRFFVIVKMCILLFFIIEILTVPITMFACTLEMH